MTIGLDSVPAQSENYNLDDIDGEILLYHVSSTRTLHLNSSAAIVWQLCDGERSIREIVALIQESFADAGDGVEDDVLSAIEELTTNGVLISA